MGNVAVTVADGLRVRSKPRVSDDSFQYEPLLPLGTQLYVLDGPVSASGYTWYEVVSLASRTHPRGWVAIADRSGEPWLGTDDFACPPMPTDFRSLKALLPSVGLACFARVPITVQARLIGCNCEMDGPVYSPGWFGLGSGYRLLVEPGVTSPPADPGQWFILTLDPAGQHPDVLPVGKVVEVTGIFDHPAAASCTEMDGEAVPTQVCRLQFAVTRLVPSSSSTQATAATASAAAASSRIVLHQAPANLGCDSIGVEYRGVTFHIDPAATEPVSAVADTGVSLVTYWSAGFHAGTAAERVVRDPAGQVVVADGDTLAVGQRLHGYFVCLAPDALYVLLADPR